MIQCHCLTLHHQGTGCVFTQDVNSAEKREQYIRYYTSKTGSLQNLTKQLLNITELPHRTHLSRSEILPHPIFPSHLIPLPRCRESTHPSMFISQSPNRRETFSIGVGSFPHQTPNNICAKPNNQWNGWEMSSNTGFV